MILTGSDKASGRIAAFGAGVNEWQVCGELLELGEFDIFLLAGLHTLLEQEALDTFVPMCQARDVGIILGGALQLGHSRDRRGGGRKGQLHLELPLAGRS